MTLQSSAVAPEFRPEVTDDPVSLPKGREETVDVSTAETRSERLHSLGEQWFSQVVSATDASLTTTLLQRWVETADTLLSFSPKNTVLLSLQQPGVEYVTTYKEWNNTHDTTVEHQEGALFIWGPIVEPACPVCHNGPYQHRESNCDYDRTPPSEWDEDIVGFDAQPVFATAQTATRTSPTPATVWDRLPDDVRVDTVRDALALQIEACGGEPAPTATPPTPEQTATVDTTDSSGTPVLSVSSSSTEAGTDQSQRRTGLKMRPETNCYTRRPTISLPAEEIDAPEEENVTGAIRQLAWAILSGDVNKQTREQTGIRRPDSEIERTAREHEATLVAHLLASRYNLAPPIPLADVDLTPWFGDSPADLVTRFERVLTVAEHITSGIDNAGLASIH